MQGTHHCHHLVLRPLDAGRDVGGVGRADEGLELGVDEGAAHGVVVTLPVPAGRFGGGGNPEDVPQELVCETEEREDCAVEDFSFNTRLDFAFEGAAEDDWFEVVVAHPSGIVELLMLGSGRDG